MALKDWKKKGKDEWENWENYRTGVVTIKIVKPSVSVWGKYAVKGRRADGMELSLNANRLTTLNTHAQAFKFAKKYMRSN